MVDADAGTALVIARGQGYVVDLSNGQQLSLLGGDFQAAYGCDLGVVLSNGISFDLYSTGSLAWSTTRISWDGVRNVVVDGTTLAGDAWMFDDSWHAFRVDLVTGKVDGGSYHEV